MRAGLHPVHPDVGLPVHAAEMQQDALPFPRFRHGEAAPVPQMLAGSYRLAHAGEAGFDAVGDKDLAVGFLKRDVEGQYGVVPEAVEVHPVVALQQWAGIFGQGRLRIDLFRPGSPDMAAGRRPGLGRG